MHQEKSASPHDGLISEKSKTEEFRHKREHANHISQSRKGIHTPTIVPMRLSSILSLSISLLFSLRPTSGGSSSSSCLTASTVGDRCSANVFGGTGSIETTCASDTDSVSVSGSVTVNKKFDNTLEVTAVPCLIGFMWCYQEYSQNLGPFCNLATHQQENVTCGSSGTYLIHAGTYDIPEEAKMYLRGVMGLSAELKIYLGYEQECETKRLTNRFSTWLGLSVIVPMAGVITLMARIGRRRRHLSVLSLNVAGGSGNHFVEMDSFKPTTGSIV